MAGTLLGQAVVADPDFGGGGYVHVASPRVALVDQDHFTTVPQVSDYLRIEKGLGAFFSFHRLPSDAWAFGKRFVHGTWRVSLNRMVAHTLVVPEEVLEALGWEPWLLVTSCRFRQTDGGPEESHGELAARSGEPGVRAAPDLECFLPEDPERERAALFARRRDFLLRLRGERGLEQDLAEVMAAVEAGRRLLLPQGQVSEQLLLFAWSALPREDRREISWTTHLAPGGGAFFLLANTPRPLQARAEQADPTSWALLGEPLAGASATALARSLVANQPAFSEVSHGCDYYQLRLAGHGEVERWVAWVARGGELPKEESANARELTALIDSLGIDRNHTAADPWHSPSSLLETAAAHLGRTSDDLPAMLALLAAARERRESGLAGRMVAERLVSLFAQHPGVARKVPGGDLAAALDCLRAAPEGLVEALRTWPDELYGIALGELRRWATGDHAAALVALGMIHHGPDEPAIRELPALTGLTTTLAGAGLPPGSWLPFAVAEAAVLDRGEDAHELARFADTLAELRVEPKAAAAAVPELLRTLYTSEAMPGAARRALVQTLAPGFVAHAAAAVAALARLERLPGAAFREWGETVEAVAAALQAGRHMREAAELRRNWLVGLASARGPAAPVALGMIRGLEGRDRAEVGKRWASKVPDLERQPGGAELAAALRQLGAENKEKDAQLDTSVADIAKDLATGQLDLEAAVTRIEEVVREPSARLDRLLRLLPQDRVGRAEAIVRLLLSPRVLPSTKRSIETELRDEALREATEHLPRALPSFEALARRESLLFAVAERYGELWTKEPKSLAPHIEAFVRAAVERKRFDVVAHFLNRAETLPRRGFLAHLATTSPNLLAALRAAVGDPIGSRDLAPFRARLEEPS